MYHPQRLNPRNQEPTSLLIKRYTVNTMLRHVPPRIASNSSKRTNELQKEENPTKILDDEPSIPMTEYLRRQVPFSKNHGGR